MKDRDERVTSVEPAGDDGRRRFLKKAGTIVVAAPMMESLTREGLLVRSAHAQTLRFDGLGGPIAGPIQEIT